MTANCDQVVQSKQTPVRAGPGFYVLTTTVFTAALALTIYYCRTMSGGMEMPGDWTMSMMWMPMPSQTWLESTVMFMLMWLAMMVAMMLPSYLPTILRYHRARRTDNDRGVLASTALMMAGYFFVWSAAGAVIHVAGIALAIAAMRWETFSRSMPFIIAATVLIAGCMQFMPWTKFGLRECRRSLACGVSLSRRGAWSAWRVGVRSGISCVTCCSGPTLILLALGMMNPAVIVLVTALIAMEKLMPKPELIVRLSGIIAVIVGLILISRIALSA
jgi:predicted metal-binding membrane protein